MKLKVQGEREAIREGLLEFEEQVEDERNFDENEYEEAVIGAFTAETPEEFDGCMETLREQEKLLHAGLERLRSGTSRG